MGRERKFVIDRDIVIKTILIFKECVLNVNKIAIVPKSLPIWENISKELDNKIKPLSLHSLERSHNYILRSLLLNIESVETDNTNAKDNSTNSSFNTSSGI